MMNFFRRRQDNRRKKPRPEGRVAHLWHGVVSLVFYCMLNDVSGGGDHAEREIVREPSAGTTSADTSKSTVEHFTTDTLPDHRKTNHEPNPCLPSLSSSIAHSPSVGRSQEGKGDGKPNTPSEKKRNWFSWFKKGSKMNKVSEKANDNDGSVDAINTKPEQGFSECSFKILQLTASPGGARKAYTSRLCSQLVHKADETHGKVANTTNDMEKQSLADGKHHDTMRTFSLSDVSSFGESEMSVESCPSFTEVTSLSSGELFDCWGLSDGQLPPSISSTSTDSFTNDDEDHTQGPQSDDTSVRTHGLMKRMDIPATCSSVSAVTTEDIAAQTDAPNTAVDQETPSSSDSADIFGNIDTSTSTDIAVSTDAPNTAADQEVPSSSDSADILGGIDTSTSTDIGVSTDAPNTVDTSGPSGSTCGEVPSGTIANVYTLIVRTLNLGVPKSTDAVPMDTCSTLDDNKATRTRHRPSTATAALSDTGNEENTSEVPEHKTPSLHKLHTEWPKHHVNIEVLLGLKAPKNSFESLTTQQFREENPLDSTNNVSLNSGTMSTPTAKDHLSGSIEAESEMAVDSGIASRGDCMTSEP